MEKQEWFDTLAVRHGRELQEKLFNSKVCVCGLGGLGSNVAISLARAGVGTLVLVDFDKVDVSNLHRQQYYFKQLGMNKTDALKQIISEISPFTEIETFTEKITKDNIMSVCDGDIICECFDNPESKALLVNEVSEKYPDKYIVCASGMAGLHTANTIKTKRLGKRIYVCGDGQSDVFQDTTLFSSRVMVCAAHQANTVLRIIAGKFDV